MQIKQIFFKTDFTITERSEAGYGVPFRFKYFTGAPSRAFVASFDGTTYTNCHLDENDNLVEVPSLKLPKGWIAGTVGAGDAFCSGVLYGAWKGMDLKSAIEMGTASAVCSLSQPGATEGMRTAEEAMKVYNDLR